MGYSLCNIILYDFMNKQTCPLFFNKNKTLSHHKLILEERLIVLEEELKNYGLSLGADILDYDPSNNFARARLV